MEWVAFLAIALLSCAASVVRRRAASIAALDAVAMASLITLLLWGRGISLPYELKAVVIATAAGLVVWLLEYERRTEAAADAPRKQAS